MSCAPRVGLALALLLTACGGGGSSTGGLPLDRWTWIDVPGTTCADGSPTGIAVRPATAHDTMLLVFLNGGGACWQSGGVFTCGHGTASPGPYGKAQFDADVSSGLDQGTILDRTIPGTPFAGATLVFVPYCTGDVHWGQSTQAYQGYPAWRHAGKANLEADLAWLAANLDAPQRLVVAGSSAGGYGSLLAHDLARTRWPAAKGYLIDDSGPPLVGTDVAAAERDAWYASWDLSATLGPLCGTACETDLSQAVAALRRNYPDDRIALVSSLQDAVVRYFLGYTASSSATDYQAALLRLVDQSFSTAAPGAGGAHAFLVDGTGHALLDDVASWQAGGTPLAGWLQQMLSDDQGWTTLGRPPP